ncbi:MAG TPA: carbon-nitrogen hydrolase family protein [Terriglobales bacterium]|nr:carbon-nitrogen hydrolase family protein [Terriglobales bacterium]
MSKVIEQEATAAAPAAVARPGRTIRVALVQSRSELGTETHDPRDGNLARALEAIADAAANGSDLVVFGEMYLSGYRTDEWLHRWATVIDPPDQHVRALVDAARERQVHLIMGMGTFGAVMPGDVYNTALLVGPGGVVGAYRKTHVAGFPYSEGIAMERCFYSPGRELPVFDTPLGRLGIHICYDMSFPEVARVQALKGAELLINVSASAGGFEEYWEHGLFMRAAENASWYMVCSVVGIQRGDRLFGGSRVVDPSGKVVASGKFDEEDVVFADIDLELARAARSTSHAFSIRQPDLYRPISDPVTHP